MWGRLEEGFGVHATDSASVYGMVRTQCAKGISISIARKSTKAQVHRTSGVKSAITRGSGRNCTMGLCRSCHFQHQKYSLHHRPFYRLLSRSAQGGYRVLSGESRLSLHRTPCWSIASIESRAKLWRLKGVHWVFWREEKDIMGKKSSCKTQTQL